MGHNEAPSQRNERQHQVNRGNSVIKSLISGSVSSIVMTVAYQPLEVLKTRIQLRDDSIKQTLANGNNRIPFGRITKSAVHLVKDQGLAILWKGTGASLLRAGPGVGLYYAFLNILQTNCSGQNHRPDSPTQAFYFGLTARSLVSFMLLPVTVVKVRYESGQFNQPSLVNAVKTAYSSSNGWAGLAPTVLRDSLFSGTYYMCYTRLKQADRAGQDNRNRPDRWHHHLKIFSYGIVSGLVASLITNPIDVLKTNIQVASSPGGNITMRQAAIKLLSEKKGLLRFFDGLVLRGARRTLISASTWTFYELMTDMVHAR